MAKTRYVSLCFLVVLATFAQIGLGSSTLNTQTGSLHVFNAADNDITHDSTFYFVNGSSMTTDQSLLAKGTTAVFPITADTICVNTAYQVETPSGEYDQVLSDWCIHGMPVSCLPNCLWIIDNKGFSVASDQFPLQFVVGWKGPFGQ